MNLQFKHARFELDAGQLLTLDDSLDVTIECQSGTLWITQDGDPRDVILFDGQHYRIDRTSRVMVFATDASVFRIASGASDKVPASATHSSGFLEWLIGGATATRSLAAPRATALAESCPS